MEELLCGPQCCLGEHISSCVTYVRVIVSVGDSRVVVGKAISRTMIYDIVASRKEGIRDDQMTFDVVVYDTMNI